MASQIITTISDQGDAALVREEGDVLRAYRDIAGFWTIGTGLTAGSGVVRPAAGMVITRAESTRLRRLALSRNYEPAVVKALPTPRQNVFDGAVLWHWNTGAISRASWVGLFLKGTIQKAKTSFLSWNKAGGKVVPALQARRRREWDIIEFANYGVASMVRGSLSDFDDYREAFKALGYDPAKGAITTIVAFQRANGLTEDGLIGPATRAAIARKKAASAANKATVGGAVAGVPVGTTANGVTAPRGSDLDLHTLLWVAGGVALSALVVYGLTLIWRYRGPLFVWLPEPVKDFFAGLGIVLGRPVRS